MKNISDLSPPAALILATLAAAAALATAYIAQYVYGHAPCELCYWQRGPLWAVVVAGPVLLLGGRRWASAALLIVAVLFLIEAGIALFHIGVEQFWWAGTEACTAKPAAGTDAASLREQLLGTPVATCDKIGWTFLGLSMATWNLPFSLLLATFMIIALVRYARR